MIRIYQGILWFNGDHYQKIDSTSPLPEPSQHWMGRIRYTALYHGLDTLVIQFNPHKKTLVLLSDQSFSARRLGFRHHSEHRYLKEVPFHHCDFVFCEKFPLHSTQKECPEWCRTFEDFLSVYSIYSPNN